MRESESAAVEDPNKGKIEMAWRAGALHESARIRDLLHMHWLNAKHPEKVALGAVLYEIQQHALRLE